MPDFANRWDAPEMMDDFSIVDDRLVRTLHQIRQVNRWTQGYRATARVLKPFLNAHRQGLIRILDMGTGIGDLPIQFVRWGTALDVDVRVHAVDANSRTIEEAEQWKQQSLPTSHQSHVQFEVSNIMKASYETDAYDVVHAAMFMHHFNQEEAAELCRRMQRWAKHGIIINDLHRHRFAYYGIKLLANVLPVSPMFAYDAPLSVLRGFRRDELQQLAQRAELPTPRIERSVGFRWVLTTLPTMVHG